MRKCMRRYLLLGLALLALTVPVRATELPTEVEEALPREAGRLLSDVSEWSGSSVTEGLCSIWTHLRRDAGKLLREQTREAATVLLIVLLCGLLNGLQAGTGGEHRLLTMAGGLAVTTLTVGSLDSMMRAGAEAMEQMSTFSGVLLPTLAAISAVSGGAVGATVRQTAAVLFSSLLLEAVHGFLMPCVYLYTGVLAAGHCMGDRRLTAVAELLKTVCVRLLTLLLLAFTLYLTVSGIFAGTVDSARVRVAKAAISGTVPVVGGIIAEASESVLAGAGLLRGTVGAFGLLGILALCAYPFLRLGIRYLLYKAAAFLASVVGDTELCGLINGLGGAFGLILGMVGSCALVLLVSVLAASAAVTA